jgi:hypothetical protein
MAVPRRAARAGGEWFDFSEVEDGVFVIARKVLPESPAARWDPEWAHELFKDALARLAERYSGLSAEDRNALDLSGQDVWDERMHEAGEANDHVAFRKALGGWERAGLEALEAARAISGAA